MKDNVDAVHVIAHEDADNKMYVMLIVEGRWAKVV